MMGLRGRRLWVPRSQRCYRDGCSHGRDAFCGTNEHVLLRRRMERDMYVWTRNALTAGSHDVSGLFTISPSRRVGSSAWLEARSLAPFGT